MRMKGCKGLEKKISQLHVHVQGRGMRGGFGGGGGGGQGSGHQKEYLSRRHYVLVCASWMISVVRIDAQALVQVIPCL